DRYATSAGSRFAVIMIRNTDVDAASWWHYYNGASAFIANNLHGRLIDIERIGNDRFDVVMQGGGGAHWWWYYGLTAAQVTATASPLGARIYRIEPYGSRFAVLLINDVNAETTRIRDLVGNDLEAGAWGFYVKKVGGGVVLDLHGDTVFEPASAIKAAHAVLALRRVRDDPALTLTSNVTWYAKPGDAARYPGQGDYADDKNKCAYTNAGTLQTGATYSDDIGPV